MVIEVVKDMLEEIIVVSRSDLKEEIILHVLPVTWYIITNVKGFILDKSFVKKDYTKLGRVNGKL